MACWRFWLFAQTTLNISPVMGEDLGVGTGVMNIAVSITALFSGIFIVVIGSLADRFGRVKVVQIGFFLRCDRVANEPLCPINRDLSGHPGTWVGVALGTPDRLPLSRRVGAGTVVLR